MTTRNPVTVGWDDIVLRMRAGERLRWVPAAIHRFRGEPCNILMLGNDVLCNETSQLVVWKAMKEKLLDEVMEAMGIVTYSLREVQP